MKKIILTTLAIIFTMVVFTSCNQSKPKVGQVLGVLYKSDGTVYKENVSVFVISDKEIASGKINNDLQFRTNNKGEFTLENIKPGHYTLYIFEQPNSDNLTGTSNPPAPIMGQISDKGKPVNFEMQASEGINLGKIEVTEIIH